MVITLTEPCRPLLWGTHRPRYRPEIGAAEALLLIGGISDPPLLNRITATFGKFQDGGVLHGAYGPRVRNQLPLAISALQADRDTRQAIVMVWDPRYDGYHTDVDGVKDNPCTIYLSFSVRKNQLLMTTHMRSNDVWLGLPYDLIQFTQLQQTVASVLGMEAGPYTHVVDSLHLYDRDLPAVNDMMAKIDNNDAYFVKNTDNPHLLGITASEMPVASQVARFLLYKESYRPADPTERWFRDILQPYLRFTG